MTVVDQFYAGIVALWGRLGGNFGHAGPIGAVGTPRSQSLAIVLLLTLLMPSGAVGQGSEQVDLGQGVRALRLFQSGEGPESAGQSLLIADVGLLGLALPEARREFDELVFEAGRDHPLLVIITAPRSGPWEASLHFRQGELESEVRYPFRLKLLTGGPGAVGPATPVVAVALLPESFSLRLPLTVRWGEAAGTVTFRN